jgi:hypothetical protein
LKKREKHGVRFSFLTKWCLVGLRWFLGLRGNVVSLLISCDESGSGFTVIVEGSRIQGSGFRGWQK